jgi:GPH family glycoside/pentoside/hexuronide:cation symporter
LNFDGPRLITQGKTSLPVRWGFALVPLASATGFQLMAVLGLRFMTDSLAIPAALAGAIFALVKIWDGIADPMVGFLSDRTKTRFGRRLPYVLAGSILMPLCILGFFAAPSLGSTMLMAGFIAIILMLHGTAYSLVYVPMSCMSVEATDDYHERSVILTYKSNGQNVSNVLGSTLPPWLLVLWSASRAGHAKMGLTIAALILVLGLAGVAMLRNARATRAPTVQTGNLWGQAVMAWRNKPFRMLVLVHVIFMIGVATAMTSNAYFTRYILHRTDAWLGMFYIFMTTGLIVAMPIWMRISRKLDKKRTYTIALTLYGLGVGSWYFSGPSEPYWMLGAQALYVGVVMSGVVLMAQSMITDAIRYDYIRTGQRREGAFSGFISLIDKFSGAIGLAGMGFMLSKMGYTSSHGGGSMQSSGAAFGIMMSFAIIPALTSFVAVLLLQLYTLKESDLVETVSLGRPLEPAATPLV